jgi:hypothetical protein
LAHLMYCLFGDFVSFHLPNMYERFIQHVPDTCVWVVVSDACHLGHSMVCFTVSRVGRRDIVWWGMHWFLRGSRFVDIGWFVVGLRAAAFFLEEFVMCPCSSALSTVFVKLAYGRFGE